MRVVIFGSRSWKAQEVVTADVGELYAAHGDALLIIEGGAEGADACGRKAAKIYQIPFVTVRAQWTAHDSQGPVPCICSPDQRTCRAAGVRRNQQMIDECKPDYGLGYRMPGRSNGTDDMAKRLKTAGIPGKIKRYRKAPPQPPYRRVTGMSRPAIDYYDTPKGL